MAPYSWHDDDNNDDGATESTSMTDGTRTRRIVSKGHKPSAPVWLLRVFRFALQVSSFFLPKEYVIISLRRCIATGGNIRALLWNGLLSTPRVESRKIRNVLNIFSRFLHKKHLDEEFERALTTRFFRNLLMLRRVQDELGRWKDATDRSEYCVAQPSSLDEKFVLPLHQVAWRFMRFATASYGQFACAHVANSMQRIYPGVLEKVTQDVGTLEVEDVMVEHIGIPRSDFVHYDCSFGGSIEHPRHFVAIDREQKAIVLAIRGTFSFSDAVADVMAMTVPFCGGYAHQGISEMALALWKEIGGLVKDVLFKELPNDYGLVIVGHSLGAGIASLMMIYLHFSQDEIVKEGRKVRCFAYASPPVFGPRSAIPPEVLRSTFHYMYGNDVVPFLSIHNVRRLLLAINTIDKYLNGLPWLVGFFHARGYRPTPQALCEALEPLLCSGQKRHNQEQGENRDNKSDETDDKSSELVVPSAHYVWIADKRCSKKQRAPNGRAKVIGNVCDLEKVVCLGIYAGATMANDHGQSAYEVALENLVMTNPQKD